MKENTWKSFEKLEYSSWTAKSKTKRKHFQTTSLDGALLGLFWL